MQMMPPIAIKRLPHGMGLELPHYATPHSAGMDLRAALPAGEPLDLAPMARAVVPLGFAMALPEGFEAQIRPRSGMAIKQGVTVVNAPGTIDADYRGEVMVGLINVSDTMITISRGDRIAQMIIAPVIQASFTEVALLDDTSRGSGGFGSTGKA